MTIRQPVSSFGNHLTRAPSATPAGAGLSLWTDES